MDANRFDTLAKLFAQRRLSRRGALKGAGTGLVAGALGSSASAQDATPPNAMATPVAHYAVNKTAFLFVQSFRSGSITPKDGEEDRYTLTLEAGLGQTIYFSDRPERIVGTTPTPEFLEGLGFMPDNPPNAALVGETGAGETDIAVVELFAPVYDEATHTATYEVEVLANWESSTELGFTEAPTDLAAVAPTFGAAHLFIDDCADGPIVCLGPNSRYAGKIESAEFDGWGWASDQGFGGICLPQDPYFATLEETRAYWANQCNQRFPECSGSCRPQVVGP